MSMSRSIRMQAMREPPTACIASQCPKHAAVQGMVHCLESKGLRHHTTKSAGERWGIDRPVTTVGNNDEIGGEFVMVAGPGQGARRVGRDGAALDLEAVVAGVVVGDHPGPVVAGQIVGFTEDQGRLTHLAQFDTLTGMPNRALMNDRLDSAITLAIISLGGNDMLRGLPPEQTRRNLDQLLTKLDERKVPALLMGMLSAPNWGADHAKAFNAIYPELARKHDDRLVPFFLQAVIDKPQLIQADRIHPTAQGLEEMVAATVDDVAQALPVRPVSPPAPR